jgi:hypothetical protein
MLISWNKKFIYIKTNKTASTSIEMALQPFCQLDRYSRIEEKTHSIVSDAGIIGQRLIPRDDVTEQDKQWFNHMSAKSIREQISPDDWLSYTKIHAIRNPFDKTLSSFFWKAKQRGLVYQTLLDARTAFEDYILHQDWSTDFDILHIDGVYFGDFAIRYEHLEVDMATISKNLDLDQSLMLLPHAKRTSSQRMGYSIAEFYTYAGINHVLKRCDWIFRRFTYDERP